MSSREIAFILPIILAGAFVGLILAIVLAGV